MVNLCTMNKDTFELGPDHEFIALDKLMKLVSIVGSGGEAHAVITDGLVTVNGEVEIQKRKKLRKGDAVVFQETEVTVV